MNSNSEGRRKTFRLQGDVPADTLLSESNYKIILTQDTLINIANAVSHLLDRKLRISEVDAIKNFVARMSAMPLYGKRYDNGINIIAKNFVRRHSEKLAAVQEQDRDTVLSGIYTDTDSGGVFDYERKELAQLTSNENSYKFTAHQNRRGDSVIDKDRVAGRRGSPNNLLPLSAEKSQQMVNTELYKTMQLLQNMLSPESTESMFARIQTIGTNYFNINLVHQIIQFDSRNRLPISNPNEFSWDVHTAGKPGQLGAVRVLDTVHQIIQLRAYPFWVPVNDSTSNPYAKIRLLIREFSSQSVTVSEFNNADLSIPTTSNYHFEFDVQQVVADRMLLVPVQDTYSFRKPMNVMDRITTQFFTPFQTEVFDPDFGVYTVFYGAITLFSITSAAAHLLNTGDLVYVYNSDSGDAAIDAAMNRTSGWYITKVGPATFTIPLDTSSLVGSESGIRVYYGSKRVCFQIEFLCLEQ